MNLTPAYQAVGVQEGLSPTALSPGTIAGGKSGQPGTAPLGDCPGVIVHES